MTAGFSWECFYDLPVIGILRGFEPAAVRELTRAVRAGGFRNLEVTMNSPRAEELIRLVRDESRAQMNVGAGTVCSLHALERALGAGATFIVTPALVPDVITTCRARGIPVIPGALTPTEIHSAWNLGADLVKVFPANLFGPGYIRDLKAPLSDVKLVPTGGVTVETLADYRRAGADAFGVGSPLFRREKVAAGDWEWVTGQARRFADAYRASA